MERFSAGCFTLLPTPSLHLKAGRGITSRTSGPANPVAVLKSLPTRWVWWDWHGYLKGLRSSQPPEHPPSYSQHSAKGPYNQPQDQGQGFEGGCGKRRKDSRVSSPSQTSRNLLWSQLGASS